MARLIMISGPDIEKGEKSIPITEAGISVGSGAKDSLVLYNPQILPGHCKITTTNQDICLSTCAPEVLVEVNGDSVHQYKLTHGDMIKVGENTFMIDEKEEEKPSQSHVDNFLRSRIESRQKCYQSTQHVLEDLGPVEKSQAKLKTLYKISNAISGILDLDQLLYRFLEIILDEFCADRGFIILLEGSEKKLVPAAIISKREDRGHPKISRTIVEEVLSTKESILCENIMDDTRFKSQDSLITRNIMSAMCVPLIRKGEILGLIHVDSQQESKFSRSDLDLLTKVAMHAAVVIENARFYKVRQEFHRNILALSHATQSVSSYLREDLIIQDATQYAKKIFQAKKSFCFLKQEEHLNLVSSATGSINKDLSKLEVPPTFFDVAASNRPILYQKKGEIPQDILNFLPQASSVLAVSIAISGQTTDDTTSSMGVLCVVDKGNEEFFTLEDQQLLSILASYTAIALSNAKFYQELKNKEDEIFRWNAELERRVAERTQELKSTQDQLSHSEKMAAVGLLAAGVAHEFNNIIASMYGFAQIAKKNKPYEEKLVDIVIAQSQRARDITESLLSFSKQKKEKLELTDLLELVESVLRLTVTALEHEGIKVIKQFGAIPQTYVNAGKIQQVFLNIIINARHAIEKNGTITITASMQDNKIHIAFRDTGKGIEPENLSKIFQPFYTTKGSFGGGTQPGTGLGLSLCYNIIKQHGGTITVSSEVGKGTCFTVILPVRTEMPPEEETSVGTGQLDTVISKVVLLIEDNKELGDRIAPVLQGKKCAVHRAMSGNESRELCKKEHFDLILLEEKLPGFSNILNLVGDLRRLEANTKIVLIVTPSEDSNIRQYMGYVDGYLRRPCEKDDIIRILEAMLGQ